MKKTIFVILIALFFIKEAGAKTLPYVVLSRAKLLKIGNEKRDQVDTFYILDYNAVFVTIYKDGTAMLIPPILGGDEGLFFTDIKAMNDMIAQRVYPVKGTGSFWEKEKARIMDINGSMLYYVSKLSEILNFLVEVKNDSEYLKQLSLVVSKKLKSKRRDRNLENYLAIYIGELIRLRVDGTWKLRKNHTFNVYYYPDVTKGAERLDILGYVIGELGFAKYTTLNIEEIVKNSLSLFIRYNRGRYEEDK